MSDRLANRVLGRFEVGQRLGAGGMGVVYEAYDREHDMRVALKTLRRVDARSLYRFKKEFRALQDLEHPNLVRLGELFEHERTWFFTMELVEGTDFVSYVCDGAASAGDAPDAGHSAETARIASTHPERKRSTTGYHPERLRRALDQLVGGLSALHAAGKVHRDIKPSNIKVTPDGHLVLLDFGLIAEMTDTRGTSHTNAVGTAEYMAPEQAAVKDVGPSADWYSVGVVLYEVLTGRMPFVGSPIVIMMDKQKREPIPPQLLDADIPRDLNALCVALLHTRPEDRPTEEQLRVLLDLRSASAPTSVSSQFTQTPPFVGRAEELAKLDAAFDESVRRGPVVALVHGESGMGKSELVRRFTEELAQRKPTAVVLAGRCYERETVPYKAFDGIVDALSRFLSRLSDSEAAELLPRRASLLPQLFPVLQRVEAIAGAPPENIRLARRDPQERRTLMFAALRELFIRLCERRPVVLFIDDLQWTDADSLTLLEELLDPTDPPPLLLVCTVRSPASHDGEPPQAQSVPWFYGEPQHIVVHELPEVHARELVELLLPAPSRQSGLVAEIAREAGGHPLFILELVRGVQEEGASEGAQTVRLEDALWARIERLPAEARALLEIVATAGAPIAREAAAAAVRQEYVAFERSVSLLRVAYLARGTGSRGADTLETCHDRVRDAVLARMDAETRRSLHERIAISLERTGRGLSDPQAVVGHLEAAGKRQKAAELAAVAASRSAAALAFDRAAAFYRKTLELGEHDDEERRSLRLLLGESLVNAGRGAEAAPEFLACAEGADPATALECRRQAAEQWLISGHIDRGFETLGALLAEIGVPMPSTPRRALMSVLWSRFRLRLFGFGWKERRESQISREQLTRLDVYKAVGTGLALVDTIRGADFQARGFLLALRVGEPVRVARSFLTEGVYQASQGGRNLGRARDLLERGRVIAEREQSAYLRAFATVLEGSIEYFSGRPRPAIPLLERGIAGMREIPGATWEYSTARLFHIYALRVRGAMIELRAASDAYLRDAIRKGDRYLETTIRRCCNLTLLAQDDLEGSAASLERAAWVPAEGAFHLQHWYELEARAEVALYQGRAREASSELQPQFGQIEASLLNRIITVRIPARWIAGRLALARGDQVALARKQLQRLRRDDLPYAHVWGRLLAAGIASQSGDPVDAVSQLRAAVELTAKYELPLCEACARLRLASLLDGDEADAVAEPAHSWMKVQKIARPERLLEVVVPGF